MIQLRTSLLALLLFAQASAVCAVEFGIARPHALGSQRQSYFERPDILQVEAREHPELYWQKWRQAHLEAAAAFLELYPTEHLYFLARDAELLYDAVRLISRDDPQTLARLHLINVSRANMRHAHLLDYLAQEGITVERLRTDSSFQPIFIDTGFSGTIPGVIAQSMPHHVRGRLKTHLLASSNTAMPSLRSFLLPINPAVNGTSPSSVHGTIVGYEHITRATDRSNEYQLLDNEWHPTSRLEGYSDGQVNATAALHYQEDLRAYLQSSEAAATLQARRGLWRELRANWTTLSEEAWIPFLKSKLENAGDARPQIEASIRDFLEWARLIGIAASPNSPIIPSAAIGLETESGAQLSNKSKLIALHPQWAPILENPDTQIPALLNASQVETLGAILDVVEDVEIRNIALRAIAQRLTTPSIYALARALVENIAQKAWAASIFKNSETAQYPELLRGAIEEAPENSVGWFALPLGSPHWSGHPELLRLAIERAPSNQMGHFAHGVFSQPHWSDQPELLRLALEKAPAIQMEYFANAVFNQAHWIDHPELLRLTLEKAPPEQIGNFARKVFRSAIWVPHPELLRLSLEKATSYGLSDFISVVLPSQHWAQHPEFMRLAIERATPEQLIEIKFNNFHIPHWRDHPRFQVFSQSVSLLDPDQRRAYLREQLDVCEQQMLGGGGST